MRLFKLPPLFLLIFLLGCTLPGQTAATVLPQPDLSSAPETLAPAPAVTEPPVTETPSVGAAPAGTETPTPVPLTIPATYLNFPTITLSPTLDVSRVSLRIVSPGPMSRVVSPINFVVHVDPDYTGTTRIELLGEDGRELYRKVFKTRSNIGYFTRVEEKINFEIKGAAEIARLQVSTFDEHGQIQAFNSVRLLLLSVGENEFNPPFAPKERIAFRFPARGQEITGGTLPLMGEINLINNTPVIFELYDDKGTIVGSRLLQLEKTSDTFVQFTTTVPYQISEKIVARLVIRQSDDRISGLAYLYSMKVVISP